MLAESIGSITKWGSNFALAFLHHHILPDMTFNWHFLIKNYIYIPKK